MASSEVDIVNMALGHLGDAANVSSISPSDGSAQADAAARTYAHIRDWLLERFAWKFAKRRALMALRSGVTAGGWTYVYAEPPRCLRLLAVLPANYETDADGVEFDTETDDTGQGLVLTKESGATALFIARVTDPGVFSPGFTETLSWFMAAALAGPIIKGETGRAEAIRCIQMASLAFSSATGLSANQSRKVLKHLPDHIKARNYSEEF